MKIQIQFNDLSEVLEIQRESVLSGESLQSIAQSNGIRIGGACGGLGLCTTCRVKILEGESQLPRLSRSEKDFISKKLLFVGERLACQFSPSHDLKILVEN